MCLYPKYIKNRKYVSNKKNGGVIPPITDERCKYVPIGCGNCMVCVKQKANSWRVRLFEEVRERKDGHFITLTLSDESILELTEALKVEGVELEGYELDNSIITLAVRRFLERWRKKYKKSVRHWLVSELGHNGTENIHLHGLIFCSDEQIMELRNIWKYGFVWCGYHSEKRKFTRTYVNERTVNYIMKYVTKRDVRHKYYKCRVLCSKGIGNGYTRTRESEMKKYKKAGTDESYRLRNGRLMALPIYYRNKIYTEKERELLWIEKLDKGIRWICGEKVEEKNTELMYNLLGYYQKVNIGRGYGSDEKDWDRVKYEESRRRILNEKRRERAKSRRKRE